MNNPFILLILIIAGTIILLGSLVTFAENMPAILHHLETSSQRKKELKLYSLEKKHQLDLAKVNALKEVTVEAAKAGTLTTTQLEALIEELND